MAILPDLSTLASAPLLAAINHLLRGQPWLCERLMPFAGRVARLQSFPIDLFVKIGADGQLESAARDAAADVVLQVSPLALLALAAGDEQARNQVTLSGEAALAAALQAVLQDLSWEVEEDLSHVVGDVAARRVVQGGRSWIAWQRRVAGNLARALGEYLTEEQPLLTERTDAQRWMREVQALRDDLERLEKRIAGLETPPRTPRP